MLNEDARKNEVLTTLRALTDEERLAAQETARQNAVARLGHEPRWDDFANMAIGEYPAWVTRLVATLLLVVLFAAANVSVYRIFTAGRDAYLDSFGVRAGAQDGDARANAQGTSAQPESPDIIWQAAVVGVAAFLLAEFTVLVSIVARRTLFSGRRGDIMLIPAALGMAMAFVGNWTVAKPHTAWGYLEAFVPPLAVLFMSLVGEQLALNAIKQRHAVNVSFQDALARWKAQVARPEELPHYTAYYANALRDMLWKANSRGAGQKARLQFMAEMSARDWGYAVQREFEAERWYEDIARPTLPPSQLPLAATAATEVDRDLQSPSRRPLLPTPANSADYPTSRTES